MRPRVVFIYDKILVYIHQEALSHFMEVEQEIGALAVAGIGQDGLHHDLLAYPGKSNLIGAVRGF